jgi:heme exporter protein C
VTTHVHQHHEREADPAARTGSPGSSTMGSSTTGSTTSGSSTSGPPAHTGSNTTRTLAVILAVAVPIWIYLGLIATPADEVQGEAVRLLYVHVPVVSVAYLACILTSAASAMWLWKRTQWWDLVAAASAELATLFTAGTLITGSIWGGAAWGSFWEWDARLTSTAMLFLLLLGYLAVRRIPATTDERGRRSAVVGLLLTPNLVVINRSVEWWRSLHQDPTVFQASLSPKIHDLMFFGFMYSMAVAVVFFVWLLIHRFRIAYLQDQLDELGLEHALAERRAEAGPEAGVER